MAESPIAQFEIKPLVQMQLGSLDISFTNSALWMVIAICAVALFLTVAMRRKAMVPGRLQSAAELLYEAIASMVRDNVGSEGRRYFPFIFTLFLFILFCNLLGMIPWGFTVTSHLIVTFTMAAVVFVAVTLIGIVRHKHRFLKLFFPEGAPIFTAPILIPIELISYLSRPVSLSVRLFANMTVGHVILKVIASFAVGAVAAGGVLAVAGIVPVAALVAITALEIMIAVIQAYVFTILSCIYLHDALHLH